MKPYRPLSSLATHEVTNVPPHMGDQDLWADDQALRDWFLSCGGEHNTDHMARVGKAAGLDDTFEKARQANRNVPQLQAFDRYGMRINAIEFHPAYHDLMDLAVSHQLHNFAWHHEGNAGHLGQAALTYLFSQPEGGVMCPMAMTYSAVPSLRSTPLIEADWLPLTDEVWLVTVSPETARQRLFERNGLSAADAESRIRAQLTNEKRREYADVEIENDGTLDELSAAVNDAWGTLAARG